MIGNQIIKKAILSEKAYQKMEKGIYTFLVDPSARKNAIKKSVESLFGVSVKKVNTTSVPPQKKRIERTRKFAKIAIGKKALVMLAPGQNIAMLSPKTKGKQSKKEKDIQKVSAEGKEG